MNTAHTVNSFKRSYNGIVSRYQPRAGAGPITRMVLSDALTTLAPTLTASQWNYNNNYVFSVSSLPNIAQLFEFYDAYRIVKVVIKFIPNIIDSFGGATTNQRSLGEIWSAIDLNTTYTTTEQQYLEYSTFKRTRFDQDHIRTIYPRTSSTVYASPVMTAYQQPDGPTWLPTAGGALAGATNVQHYGLLASVMYDSFGGSPIPPAGTNQQTWRVFVTYTIDFRAPN